MLHFGAYSKSDESARPSHSPHSVPRRYLELPGHHQLLNPRFRGPKQTSNSSLTLLGVLPLDASPIHETRSQPGNPTRAASDSRVLPVERVAMRP